MITHHGRKGERRSFSEADYATLIAAAHQQLHAPIILIWDNLNTHISRQMRAFTDTHTDWLTVVRLPAYAPDLNPVEGLWGNIKGTEVANLCADGIDEPARAAHAGIDRVRAETHLAFAFLRHCGLPL